jgi:hypothetical protein
LVPSRWSPPGEASFSNLAPEASRVWLKSNGAIHGAKIAKTTNITVRIAPTSRM